MSRHETEIRPRGWHRDPTGRHEFREWDGHRWTEHVSDAGRASIDPIVIRRRRRSRPRGWSGLVARLSPRRASHAR